MLGDELRRKVQPYADTSVIQQRQEEETKRRAVKDHVDFCMSWIMYFFESASPEELYEGKMYVSINYDGKEPLTMSFFKCFQEPIYDNALIFKKVIRYESRVKMVNQATYNKVPYPSKFSAAISHAAEEEGLKVSHSYDNPIISFRYQYE